MMDMGVASPRAQGQAMISTATALTTAWARRGSGPHRPQTTRVTRATSTTAGTNQPATWSASRWIGARERCASPTMRTIWASRVSAPTRSARISRVPVPFRVAPISRSPAALVTGIGSPVTMDSSTVLRPSVTVPSTGIFSPGRTRSRFPGCTASRLTSTSVPSSRTSRALLGANPSSSLIAALVLPRARSSSTCPRSTRVVMTAAASK